MATTLELYPPMSTTETNRTWRFVFTDDMLAGAVLGTATYVHTPPSGSPATPTGVIVSPETNPDGTTDHVVYVTLPSIAVTGIHYLECRVQSDNTGSIPTETLSLRGRFEAQY